MATIQAEPEPIDIEPATTVREAYDHGYRCIVLRNCCASYFPEFTKSA